VIAETAYGWWLPLNASKDGGDIDRLITVVHWFMGVLFVVWSLFFLYCLVRFRRRPGRAADPRPVSGKVSKYGEIGVAVFEAVLLLGFSVPVLARVREQMPDRDKALTVRVVAEQFAWNVQYPGEDGVFGRLDPRFIAADNLIGLDHDDPYAKDDLVLLNHLHIPVDTPIIVELSSKDVIHSFFLPVMRVKQDVMPGMQFPIWFEAARTGEFDIACAQLCGNNHYKMQGRLHVHTKEDFNRWLAEALEKAKQEIEIDMEDFEL
jgi:cytochrome c oxidase subunit 2